MKKRNKTAVEYVSIEYFTSEDKRKTICKLVSWVPYSKVNECNFTEDLYNANQKRLKELGITMECDGYRIVTTGEAKIINNDVYDETFAKHLSLSKAQEMVYSKVNRLYKMIQDSIIKYLNRMDVLIEGTANACLDCHYHIGELIDNKYGK